MVHKKEEQGLSDAPVMPLKVLVADDNAVNRKLAKALLTRNGCETYEAENGRQAVELFEKAQPDLVIMDIMMPEMDGYEATRHIKEKAGERFVPVIVITALDDDEAMAKSIACGADDFLAKPIKSYTLQTKIKAMERIRRLYAEQTLQNEKLSQEHEIASTIFSKVMHSDKIECSNVKYLLSPMDIVGGDHVLCAPKPSGGMYAFLGDFTGHGLSAAVGAIPVADTFYAMTDKNLSICDMVSEINHKLKATLPPVIFLAACVTELNYEKGTLTVWNGGIPDMLVVGKNGGIKNRLPSRHLPLGVVGNEKLELDVEICDVEKGDRIYIYSDGVIETTNQNEEMFGQERFEEFFRNKYDHERILETISSDLEAFRGDAPPQDDITLLEITCAPLSVRSLDDESALRQKAAYDGWNLSLKFDAETLRTVDVPSFLIKMIEEDVKLKEHKENIFLIMKELVTNALEHGLLHLPSEMKKDLEGFEQYVTARQEALDALSAGWIKVNLEFSPIEKGGKLLVRVEDTGTGFNYQQRLSDLAENVGFAGRGIPLVRSLCKEVTYHGNGNRVQAVYAF